MGAGVLSSEQGAAFVSFEARINGAQRFTSRWIRGDLPKLPSSELELLRVEMPVPPATKSVTAGKVVLAGLRKVATAMGLPVPAAQHIRQLQTMQELAVGIFSVPRDQARTWLQGSGCSGIYLRPFWTGNTGAAVSRNNFHLLWARGRLSEGPQIWEHLRREAGVVGLLVSGKDVAVRITSEADVSRLQSLLCVALKDNSVSFRRAVTGQRWWKLGPLTDAEMWRVKDIIRQFGLDPLRDEVRFARMGPFRSMAYFAATGDPKSFSLDDGSWGASAARLSQADPPPRKPTASASALPPQSTWGGARKTPGPTPGLVSEGQALQGPGVITGSGPTPMGVSVAPRSVPQQRGKSPARSQPAATPSGPRVVPRPSRTEDQLQKLTDQVALLLEELTAMRQENAQLRQQLQSLQHAGQPLASSSGSSVTAGTPCSLAGDSSAPMPLDRPGLERSPPPELHPKRSRPGRSASVRRSLSLEPPGSHD